VASVRSPGPQRGADGKIDHSVEDGKDESYFEQVRENVDLLREEYGAEDMLNLEDLPDDVDSLNAQVASYYVLRTNSDRWQEFDDAIYEALWIVGEDVGDVNLLVEIAEDVGLDGEEIRRVLSNEDERERICDRFEVARERGVTGVPTFVYDDYSARGAVRPAHLERLV
jgi:predicted DsbA family dithiol-disulfide isomerase